MTERVLFESESEQTRAAIASYLRNVAERLESGRDVTLKAGEESVTVDPPAEPTFAVRAERDGPEGTGELSIGFELGWDNSDGSPDEPQDSGWTSNR
jgi:amphi-Trp domain-containing protein